MVATVAAPLVAVQGVAAAEMVGLGREVAWMVAWMEAKVEAAAASTAAGLVAVATVQAMWGKAGARVAAVETVCMGAATVAGLVVREEATMAANVAVAAATVAATEAKREAGPVEAMGWAEVSPAEEKLAEAVTGRARRVEEEGRAATLAPTPLASLRSGSLGSRQASATLVPPTGRRALPS